MLLTALLALYSSNATAQTHSKKYYVNSFAGNDNSNGAKSRPFKSINKINSLSLEAGDTILFSAGQVFEGTLLLLQKTGTAKHPIVISTYGKGRAVINAGDSAAMVFEKCKAVKIEHLKLIGSGRKTGNVKDGLAINYSNWIWVNDLDISCFQKSGLRLYSSQQINVSNVFAHDNGSAGITVEAPYQTRESRHIRILNCRAENNPGDPTNLTNHSGNGIVVGDCKNVLIDRCTATNNGWDMPRIGNGPVGIWAYEADSVIIQRCLSYKNKTSKGGADGGGFDLDGGVTNSIVQYNMSYDNQGSGYCIFQYWGASPWYHNTFRYNISENDGTISDSQAGLYIWNTSDGDKQFHDCDVYGNIIYNDKVSAICWSKTSDSHGLRFFNNVFVGRDSLIWGKDKIGDARYYDNLWWSINKIFYIDGVTDIYAWANQTGKEKKGAKVTGLNVNPRFKKPGMASLTSAAQLKYFTNYWLRARSVLRGKPVYNSRYGIKNIRFD